jgi:outer membrane receptor protein involved in Fe transport
MRKLQFCLAVFALLALSFSAFAQVQNGQFAGTVTDPAGLVVANAKVTVTNPATNLTVSTTTNASGNYTVKELPVGTYRLTAEAPGFKTVSDTNVVLNAGVIAHVDFKMTVGQAKEVVEVTGEMAQVNTEDSKLASTVGSAQISNLPLNGRNVFDLIRLNPGAVDVRGVLSENGHGTVVNGLRENFNGFLINGVSNKGLSGGSVNTPIEETVEEFQQLTLNNSAQYGNSAGSITNVVTKSGSNNLHGGGWWFLRNDNLDATPYFVNHVPGGDPLPALTGEPKPELRFNQFGGTLGGPIIKDKLFFFVSYQGDRFVTSNDPALTAVESPEWRAAVIAAAPITAAMFPGQVAPGGVAAQLYSKFAPSVPGSGVVTINNFSGNSTDGLTFSDWLCPDTYAPSAPGLPGIPGDPTGVKHAQAMANILGVFAGDYANPLGSTGALCPLAHQLANQAGTFDRNSNFENKTITLYKQQTKDNLFHGNEASLRLDWNPNDKNRFFTEFKWFKSTDGVGPQSAEIFGSGSRGFDNPIKNVTPHFSFNWVHTFSPQVVNEFRAGYLGNIALVRTTQAGVPSIAFDSLEMGFGSYNGYPQFFKENIYTYSDLLSITKGKHNMKVGYELRRNIENSEFNVSRPSYYFTDPVTFAVDAPYEELAGTDPCIVDAGAPDCANGTHLKSNFRHWRNWEHGAFFQDDWKISRRLTLNLGIRYDLYQRHTEENNLATLFQKGPGTRVIDDITTGAGWLANANVPFGSTGTINGTFYDCTTAVAKFQSPLAGVCGPGGFTPSKTLGAGNHKNFGPRVGFAWDVFGTGKTSLRGGFGISYEGTLYNPLSNSRWNMPYYNFADVTDTTNLQFASNGSTGTGTVIYGPQSVTCLPVSLTGAPCAANNEDVPGTAGGTGNVQGFFPGNRNFAFLTGELTPQGLRDPYVYNFYLGIQHEIFSRTVLELNYVGTAGHRLFRAEDINRIPGGRFPCGTVAKDTFGRTFTGRRDCIDPITLADVNPNGVLNPNYLRIRNWQNSVNSNYNAMQVSLRKQASHGVTLNVNYTWSHSLDIGSTWHSGATSANGRAPGEAFSTDQTIPNLDYGNSIYDIRHRFVLNYIWEMPWYKNAHGAKGLVLGGWQWNGIWSFQSGAHWSPFCSSTSSCNFQKQTFTRNASRVDVQAPNVSATHDMWADGWGDQYKLGGVGANTFFSRPCDGHVTPQPGETPTICYGNERRNQFVGPNFFNADISLFKTIKVSERVNMQFRSEAFNVLNRTNFQLPGGINNRVNAQPGSAVAALAVFGQSAGTFNPRQLQFGLKLTF